MFTGLIKEVGTVKRVTSSVIVIQTMGVWTTETIGASIAVNGVCLTLTARRGRELHFDISPTTLKNSSLGSKKSGGKVNLEPAMTLASKLDGHMVLGHIDTTIECLSIVKDNNSIYFEFTMPEEYKKMIALRGSVAIDGISLTVSEKKESSFKVTVIPHTLKVTTLGGLKVGDFVNFECDVLARYIAERVK